ncbi:PREDICTED: cytochrome P450 71B36-like [Populus euphratica]|uniref:Cytochrome P450 71B36-like n=1 Tax=Populus euphratica TaxID=75702 RepID=A0AAJ6XNG6_POPEU|nr:PREDICTED: cytochrome P450 71B36-like [Populus euphratica]
MFLLIRKKQNKQQIPPTPPRLPIIGNLHQLGDLSHRSLWQLSKKYAPVILLKLGAVPAVVISSAMAAKEVLKTNDLHACSRPVLVGNGRLSYSYSDVSFTYTYGDYWRKMRKICVLEHFSARRGQSFLFIREEEVALLIDTISACSFSATPVDLSEKILSFTANITCRAAFGKSFQEIKGLDGKRFEVIREVSAILASFSATDFFPKVGWIIERLTGLLHSRIERSFRELDVLYQRVTDDHIKLEEEQEDIVGGRLMV